MKLLTSIRFSIIIICLFFVNACQRDLDIFIPDNNNIGQIINPLPVQASIRGVVLNENNEAVPGATVKAGTNTTITDSKGHFSFSNIQLDKYASVVIVETDSYFKGIRTFSSKENSSGFIKIKLIPKSPAGNFDAAAGGNIAFQNSSAVIFPANGVIVKATGQAYTGTVNVFASHIDPTSADIAQIVPGSFQATDSNNLRALLKSFGMAAVQLEGQAGELLQIAPGKKAKLRLPIPSSLTGSAPSSIPMWYLNESDGLWKQEGTGTKTGNFYEGEVSHFSFWNYDIASNSILLELTVNSSSGPLPNTLVKISRVNTGGNSYGYTDSLGYVGGFVFANEALIIEIRNNCNDIVYTQNIGPFAQNTNLGTITIPVAGPTSLIISGDAVDCNNQPVANGNAFIFFEGQLYLSPISNGNFSTTITRCALSNGPVEVLVNDFASQQQSVPWTGNATTGIVNTGTLTACATTDTAEFFYYTVDSVTYGSPTDSFNIAGPTGNDSLTRIYVYRPGVNNYGMTLMFSGYGTAGVHSLYIDGYNGITTTHGPLSINITAYGPLGQFVEGNFSGVVTDAGTTNNHMISGNFRLRHDN